MKVAKQGKRLVVCALLALVCAFGVIGLAGCANAEQEVRAQVESELNAVKDLSDETIEGFVGAISSDDAAIFDSVGLDPHNLVRAYFDGFDYAIDSVAVDGDTAQVTVTLTCKTSENLNAAMQAALENFDYLSIVSTGDLTPIGDALVDAVQAVGPVQTDPVTVTYTRVDGAWVADESAQDAIAAVMM